MNTPKVYHPSRYRWGIYLAAALCTIVLIVVRGGARIVSPAGFIVTAIVLLLAAYLEFYAFRVWVHLYDTHLDVYPSLSKLLAERCGLPLGRPIRIYYREIKALRRTRGFVGYNALVVVRGRRLGWRSAYGIPCQGVENYSDLEKELLQRVPPNCELYSMNILGRRGPFT